MNLDTPFRGKPLAFQQGEKKAPTNFIENFLKV